MASIRIESEETGAKGRYFAFVEGFGEPGEMTYSRASDVLVIVDHTAVPDSLRGHGVGKALAERVVADARKHGFRIVPLCPFFRSQADRHPDWSDVVLQ